MNKELRGLTAAAATAILLTTTVACSDDDNGSGNDDELDQLTYVTAFGAQGRDAFAWVAESRGIFEEAGLDVDIQPGSGTGPNLQSLEAGQADIAAMDMTGAMIEAGLGNHTDFQIFAAIHQSTLVAIISLEGYDVTTPTDLEGRQLGAATASVNQLLFPAYAAAAGVDESQIEWIDADPPTLPGLLAAGEVDALSTFSIGATGVEVAAEGTPSVVLPYSEYLPDLYGNGMMTTNEFAEENSDVVERFRDAMLEALEWSVNNPDEAAEILNEANPDSGIEAAVGEITAMTDAVIASEPVGLLEQDKVANAIALLEDWELIEPGLTPEDVVNFDLAPAAG